MNERIYVAVDVETTGLVAGSDEIIEVAAVKFRGREILERYSQLVQPRQSLPLKITRLTGITLDDLASAPSFNAIGADVARFIKTHPIIGHSVNFDLTMLRAQGMNFNQPVYDTFDLATLLMPQAPIYKLGALADRIGIAHPADHRALNDAEVTAQVFTYLLEQIDQLSLDTLNEIVRLTQRMAWSLHDLFEEALSRKARTVFVSAQAADLKAAKPKSDDNDPQPLRPTGDARPLDPRLVEEFFAPDGTLGRSFSGYEQRAPQVQMAMRVTEAFNTSEPQLIEAGTGTGKSIAYLTPAAMFAARR
ncbi:MAG: DNA polymerase III subunit epsilon, partial [Oscillochloris sp.]|nr:DNA polymerase III subunit epsilon [Oscillochloris sp.]